ncbi:hypothetical protein JXO52_05325 [bacterium]|nr:hypothetical protein [bacterium]
MLMRSRPVRLVLLFLVLGCARKPPVIYETVQVSIGSTAESTTVNTGVWEPEKYNGKIRPVGYVVYLIEAEGNSCSRLEDRQLQHCQIAMTDSKETNIHDLGFSIDPGKAYCMYYVAVGEDGNEYDMSYHETPVTFPFQQIRGNYYSVDSLLRQLPLWQSVQVVGAPRRATSRDGAPPARKTDWILESGGSRIYVSSIFDAQLFSHKQILIVGLLKENDGGERYLEGVAWREF